MVLNKEQVEVIKNFENNFKFLDLEVENLTKSLIISKEHLNKISKKISEYRYSLSPHKVGDKVTLKYFIEGLPYINKGFIREILLRPSCAKEELNFLYIIAKINKNGKKSKSNFSLKGRIHCFELNEVYKIKR
jgi:hypothetical protein